MSTKVQALRRHVKRRASSRYNLKLNRKKIAEIVKLIQSNKARFIKRRSNRVTEFEVNFEGTNLGLLYDKQRKTLITCLTPKK